MEDVSDFLQKQILDLKKQAIQKNYQQKTLKSRMEEFNDVRRQTRASLMYQKRKIDIRNLSPFNTPDNEKIVKKPVVIGESKPNKRLEMLHKWKAEKEKKKREELRKIKPVFKVYHIPIDVGLPNLDKVNKEIKGKPIKTQDKSMISKFAPNNHVFKAPANVKPIHFNYESITNKNLSSNEQRKINGKNEIASRTAKKHSTPKNVNISHNHNLLIKNETRKVVGNQQANFKKTQNVQKNVKMTRNATSTPKVPDVNKSNKTINKYIKSPNKMPNKVANKLNKTPNKSDKMLNKPSKALAAKPDNLENKILGKREDVKKKQPDVKEKRKIQNDKLKTNVQNRLGTSLHLKNNVNKRTIKETLGNKKSVIKPLDKIVKKMDNIVEENLITDNVYNSNPNRNQNESDVLYSDDEITLKTPRKTPIKTPRKTPKRSISKVKATDKHKMTESRVEIADTPIENKALQSSVVDVKPVVVLSREILKTHQQSPLKTPRNTPKRSISKVKTTDTHKMTESCVEIADTPTENKAQQSSVVDVNRVVGFPQEILKTPRKTPLKTYRKTPKKVNATDDFTSTESVMHTPTENKAPEAPVAYISPFVTISRGKESARKEYKIRQSTGGTMPYSPDVEKTFVASSTSPKAGALYFSKILDDEISKIENVCDYWNSYKDKDIPDDAKDLIDTAIGQSKLLMAKKFQQFRDLIIQCRDCQYKEKPVSCVDLHGFWDMIYMQVEDVNKRFGNLEKLRNNNWQEFFDDKEKTKNVKTRPTRQTKIKAASKIKDMIKKARARQNTINKDKVIDCIIANEPPLDASKQVGKHRLSTLKSESVEQRASLSPGLTMMKITQAIKQGDGVTPSSILKKSGVKSERRMTKCVLFKDIEEVKDKTILMVKELCKENVNLVNISPLTPRRRSKRISNLL